MKPLDQEIGHNQERERRGNEDHVVRDADGQAGHQSGGDGPLAERRQGLDRRKEMAAESVEQNEDQEEQEDGPHQRLADGLRDPLVDFGQRCRGPEDTGVRSLSEAAKQHGFGFGYVVRHGCGEPVGPEGTPKVPENGLERRAPAALDFRDHGQGPVQLHSALEQVGDHRPGSCAHGAPERNPAQHLLKQCRQGP